MKLEYDSRTGRPQLDGRDVIESLSDEDLEVELTIAAAAPQRRAQRLDALLVERARRRALGLT